MLAFNSSAFALGYVDVFVESNPRLQGVQYWIHTDNGRLYTDGTFVVDSSYDGQLTSREYQEFSRRTGIYISRQSLFNGDPDRTSFYVEETFQTDFDTYVVISVGSPQTYIIYPSAGSGGTINPSSPKTVTSGGSATFTASANNGYAVDKWYLDGTLKQTSGTSYTVSNVTQDHDLYVTFKSTGTTNYIVTPSAGTGGSISPNSPVTVSAGGSATFSATANTGYAINQWLVNGSYVRTGGSSYTVSNVQSNTSVKVTFTAQTYTVTPSAGPNGTIDPNSTQTVGYGGYAAFVATPNLGYSIYEWRLDGSLVQTGGNSYTVNNVTFNRTLSVSFKADVVDVQITGPPSSPTIYRLDLPQAIYVTGTYTGPVTYVQYKFSNSDDSLYTYGRSWSPAHIDTASTWSFPLISPDDLPLGTTIVYAKGISTSGAESAIRSHTINYGMTPLESPNEGNYPGNPLYAGSATPKPVVVDNALEARGSYRVTEARLLGGDFDPTKVLASRIVWLASRLEPDSSPVSIGGQQFYPLTGSTGAQVLSALSDAGQPVPAGRVYITALRLAAPSFKQTVGFTAYYDFDLRVEAEASPSFVLSQQALSLAVHWESALDGMRCLPDNDARLGDAVDGALPDLTSLTRTRIVTRPWRGTIDRDWTISGSVSGATAMTDRMRKIFRDADLLTESGSPINGAIGEATVGSLGWRATALPDSLGGPGGREPFYIERPTTATDRAKEQREKDRQDILNNTGNITLQFWGADVPSSSGSPGDVTRPTVTITSPTNWSTTTSNTLNITGTASDNISVASVWVRANGGTWIKATGTTSWSAAMPFASIPSGSYITIEAQAIDSAGNPSAIASTHVYFSPTDTTRPSIAINSPSEGSTVTSQTVTFSGTASDNVALSSVRLRVNSGPWVTPTGVSSWSVALKLGPGSNTIEAQAIDTSANTQSAYRQVTNGTSDTTSPTVAIQSPANGATVTSPYLTVAGTASDNISVGSVSVRINGGTWVAATGTTAWSTSAILSLGANTIEARAQDWAGIYSATISQTITFQPAPRTAYPPTIDLAQPAGYFADGADVATYGASGDDQFGSVIRAADLNGDTISDLIVAAPGATPLSSRIDAGAVYVWFGKGSVAGTKDVAGIVGSTPDLTIRGATAGDMLGTAMATGDVNGDGFTDLVIGATLADGPSEGRTDAGEAYVVFGRASFPATISMASTSSTSGANVTIYGATTLDYLTSDSALVVADINDDGYADILLGSQDADGSSGAPRTDSGEAYIVLGRATFPTTLDLAVQGSSGASTTFYGPSSSDRVTRGGLTAADVNGDGVLDIVIGARGGDGPSNGRANAGEAYIIFGKRSPSALTQTIDLGSAANVTIYGATASDRLTYANALRVGDFNGDGYDDLALGAAFADGPSEGRVDSGEVYLVFGRTTFPSTLDLALKGTSGASVTIYGVAAYDYLTDAGQLAVGDVNDDGYVDLAVGSGTASGASATRSGSGEAYIIFGRSSFPTTLDLATKGSSGASVTISGAYANDGLTAEGALALRDINGDGIADMILGAPYANSRTTGAYAAGEVCVVLGRQSFYSFPTTLDLRNTGPTGASLIIVGSSQFGLFGGGGAIATGDFNGDAVPDLAVGNLWADGPFNDRPDGGDVHVLMGVPPGQPAITSIANVAINEDSATGPLSFTVSDPQLPGEALNVTATSSNTTLVPTANVTFSGTGATRTVSVQPASNRSGSATVTLRLSNGSLVVFTSFVVTVNAVNDEPSFVKGGDQSVLEDSGAVTVTNWATSLSSGTNESQVLTFHATPANPALFAVPPAISSSGTLTFTPAANANGSTTVSVYLQDNGGTANGGDDTSPTQTFNITMTAVNDPPSLVMNGNPSVLEDAGPQVLSAWASSISRGASNEGSQTLTVTTPTTTNGALFAVMPALNVNTGDLTFTPAADANGSATVSFTLIDSGGTSNGGVDRTSYSFTITVVSVNDAPVFVAGPNKTVLEESGAVKFTPWASVLSAGPADESGQTLTLSTTIDRPELFVNGRPDLYLDGSMGFTPVANRSGTATITWTIVDNGGTANGGGNRSAPQTFTITITGINDAPSFTKGADVVVNEDAGPVTRTGWATNIDRGGPDESNQVLAFSVTGNTNPTLFAVAPQVAPDGTLTFTPAANVSGTATVTFRLTDDGGTANGGVNTSATQSFVITVNSVNDAPTFVAGPNQTVWEDSGAKSVSGWASSITAGAPNESAQTVSFVVSNDFPALFAAAPQISANGTLTYTLAANAFGVANVTVRAQDTGGTANGGKDMSDPLVFTITVSNVNDVPAFVKGADQTVNEDAGPQIVANWATGISAGPANESAQALDFVIGNSSPALFAAGPTISANGTLTFTTAPNASGSATLTVAVHDNGGTSGGGVDTSATQTFNITVRPVNDAPVFVAGADVTVTEDAPAQSIASWATGISAGAPDEAVQTLNFTIANDNPSLFTAPPVVGLDGRLTFTPAPDASGVANVSLSLRDNGGTANGGSDTSATRIFKVTVLSSNDAPSFVKGGDQKVLEDSGTRNIAAWATAISAGPASESTQTLTFVVTTDKPALFASGPAISSAGTLSYTPAPDAFGTAQVTVTLRDSGGTANSGQDTSGAQTFAIVIGPVNDGPTLTAANVTVKEDAGAQTMTGWGIITPGAANEDAQTVTVTTTNDAPQLFAVEPKVAANGTLIFTPAPDAHGIATISVTLHDDGGTADGGADTSATKTFSLVILSLNDAPTFTRGADVTVKEEDGAQTLPGWAMGMSPGPEDESGQRLSFVTQASRPELFSTPPTIAPNGTLIFTPAPNRSGTAVVTVRLSDDGGTANGGADTSSPQQFAIVIEGVNDAPTFTKGADQNVREDAGAINVPGWATQIDPGGPDESTQVLTFDVVVDNPGLFVKAPAVSADGTLSYRTAPDLYGTATVTITLADDGGTSGGGGDHSAAQSFMINVSSVNDAPVFTKGEDLETARDAGPQIFPGWASEISPGAANEDTQRVSFVVSSDQPALFSQLPAIDPDGTLRYAPAAAASGIATVTVSARDTGGTGNGGADTSATEKFTIAITSTDEESGTYNGLVQPAPGGPRENARAGAIQVTIKSGAIFTGKIKLAGETFPIKGRFENNGVALFDPSGATTLPISPKDGIQLQLTLDLEVAENTGTLGGLLTRDGAAFATISADRVAWSSSAKPKAPLRITPDNLPGNYTVIFPAPEAAAQTLPAANYPHGDGFGRLSVSAAGVAKLTATLADGTKISASAPIAKSGRWPLYFASGKTASLSGFVMFHDVPQTSDLDSTSLDWFKPAGEGVYPRGWAGGLNIGLAGAKYTTPKKNTGDRMLPGQGDAEISFTINGQPASISQQLYIGADHRVRIDNPQIPGLKLTLTPATGLFQGSVGAAPVRKFNGAVLQKQRLGAGFYLHETGSEAVTLAPTP